MDGSFVNWIIDCPLMRCYVDPDILKLIDNSSIGWENFEKKRTLRNLSFIQNEIGKIDGLINTYDEELKEITSKIRDLIEVHTQERKRIILEEELKRKDIDRKEKENINNEIKHIDLFIAFVKFSEPLEELEESQRRQKMQRLRYVAQKNDLEKKIASEKEKLDKMKYPYKNVYKYSNITYNVYDLLTNQML